MVEPARAQDLTDEVGEAARAQDREGTIQPRLRALPVAALRRFHSLDPVERARRRTNLPVDLAPRLVAAGEAPASDRVRSPLNLCNTAGV